MKPTSKVGESRFPPTAIQHTRCMMAVVMVDGVLRMFNPGKDSILGLRLPRLLERIKRWQAACAKQIKGRSLSRGAERDLERQFSTIDPYFRIEGLHGDALMRRWAALVWAALTFVEDVCCTCPAFRTAPCWRFLRKSMEDLGNDLMFLLPGIDEEGTSIYMEVA